MSMFSNLHFEMWYRSLLKMEIAKQGDCTVLSKTFKTIYFLPPVYPLRPAPHFLSWPDFCQTKHFIISVHFHTWHSPTPGPRPYSSYIWNIFCSIPTWQNSVYIRMMREFLFSPKDIMRYKQKEMLLSLSSQSTKLVHSMIILACKNYTVSMN